MRSSYVLPIALATLVVAAALAGPPRRGDFPGYGFIPKADTGADRFLHKYPEYDGRGVIVAIFDTGVDPGAPGLQVTSDGKPKIVDVVDGSGSGDVDTSTVVQAEDGAIIGLTGRRLTINPAWNNPTSDFHIGIKRAYEVYPGGLVGRLRGEHREDWDEQQGVVVAALESEVEAWKADHPSPTSEKLKELTELELRIEQLNALQDDYEDAGPVFDCVVFHDGKVWRGVIDTDEDGDLSDEQAMANFRLERQYSTFGDEDLLNYALNIYDDGNLLSIVADVGTHGTHVAGIVAAYFPDQPELNGLAPGAQIVAVKIGDNRLDSNSCATGEVRGCIAALQNRCDLINQSYGEASSDPNVGSNQEIYSEFVNKHGIIYVSSAGNAGPALSTSGYPGSGTEAILSVGAYVSPDMMEVQYSMRERLPANQFTWSSRGPTYDGALAVNFSAPGGAISPVPNWSLQRNLQANGTSMSAPNACGNIALLLSGLKAEGIAYSPHRIRRALENTAEMVPDVEIFTQGHGLVQVDRAFEYVKEFAEYADQDVRFNVRVSGGGRGVYLREPYEIDQTVEPLVTVTPVFHDDADNREKIDFELRVSLESTVDWVECADYLMLMHGGRRMRILVDPTRLAPGAHYAEVRGYDSTSPDRGPIFRVPITVIRPVEIDEDEYTYYETYEFEPGQVEHRFIAVPPGATWADFRIRRLDEGESRLLLIHALQLVPGYRFIDHALESYFRLAGDGEVVRSMKVVGGRMLNVCLAQYWSSIGSSECELEVTFHGIVPDRQAITVDGSALVTRVNVETPLHRERVMPRGSLKTLRRSIRPVSSEIRPLEGYRDELPDEQQLYELVLTYDFKIEDGCTVTPRVALYGHAEYQESWQSIQYMIFDAGKRIVERFGLYARSTHLDEGDYVLRFHARHVDREQLEGLRDMTLMLDQKLSSSVGLDFYSDPDDVNAGGGFGSRSLPRGGRAAIFVGGPCPDDLPDAAEPGDLLLGTMTFGDGEGGLPGADRRPGGFPVTYVVPPDTIPHDNTPEASDDDDDEQTAAEELAEAVRDFKVERLAKLHGEDDRGLFDQLAEEILRDFPNHLPVLVERLRRADGDEREDNLAAVVAAADAVIAQIDKTALAAHFGVKLDPDDMAAAKVRKEMDKRKKALIEALHLKARALFDMADAGNDERPETDADTAEPDAFETAFAELRTWVDTTGVDYVTLHADREVRHGRLAAALELLNEKIADEPTNAELYEQRIELLDALGWEHWKAYEEQWRLIRFPAAYPPL